MSSANPRAVIVPDGEVLFSSCARTACACVVVCACVREGEREAEKGGAWAKNAQRTR